MTFDQGMLRRVRDKTACTCDVGFNKGSRNLWKQV